MKILFNCLTTEKGGAERVISVLANEFVKKDDVVILTLKRNTKDAYKFDEKIKRLYIDKTCYESDSGVKSIFRKLSPSRLLRLKRFIIDEDPDIIISFLPEPSLRLMFASKFSSKIRKIPKIISIRNDPEKEYSNVLIKQAMKKFYRDVDGMVYQTEDAKKYFKGIIKTRNQVIIQNPIDERFLIKPKDDKDRKDIIISVGRLESQKNHELLIRAFGRMIEEEKNDYCLEIYGEGSRRQYLQEMINKMNLNNKVFLKGKTDDIVKKMNNSKIFVLSSRYEGMPNALMEAMALGLPCISTDCPCGGPRSLTKNGENGILVKNGDKDALGCAISNLINDDRMRKILSRNALRIRKDNDVNTVVEQWYTIINRVMETKE